MIYVAIGSNLPAEGYASSLATCRACVDRLKREPDLRVVAQSSWYESEPVPVSEQPWFINGVFEVETPLSPGVLMARLHAVEAEFGRRRAIRNEARPLDLDLIDYDGQVISDSQAAGGLVLPHPRMHQRSFVLLPLRDLVSRNGGDGTLWLHPTLGQSLAELIDDLPPQEGRIRRVNSGDGDGGGSH